MIFFCEPNPTPSILVIHMLPEKVNKKIVKTYRGMKWAKSKL